MKTLAMVVAWIWVMGGVVSAQEDVALVGNAFVPEEIPGLKCNLDAYQFRTLTNGASVGTWVCEKTGIILTNSITSQQPKYKITNGFGFLRFDGVDDFLRQPIGQPYPSGTTNRIHSFCTAVIGRTFTASKGLEGFGGTWSAYWFWGYQASNMVTAIRTSVNFVEPFLGIPPGNEFVNITTDSNPTLSWHVNGSFVTSTNLIGVYANSTVGFTLGEAAATTVKYVTQVPQILIYSNTLSFIQRKHVEEYLSSRYKIPNVSRQ